MTMISIVLNCKIMEMSKHPPMQKLDIRMLEIPYDEKNYTFSKYRRIFKDMKICL
jgi:hypothetical protein